MASSRAPTSVTNASFTSTNTVSLLSCASGRKVYRVRGVNFEVDERYSVLSVVGYGAYGTVVAANDEVTGREVAIKKIGRVFDDLIDARRIWREVSLLRLLNQRDCRGIMKFLGILSPRHPIESFKELYLVTELYDTDLFQVIRRKQPFDLASFKRLACQLLQCVADMHSAGVIHRDIKPANVLLSNTEDVHVCDFGLARGGMHVFSEPGDFTDYVVTRWYRPPELLTMSRYHFPVDIFAVGCVLGEYALGRPLFIGRDYVHQLKLVVMSCPHKDIDLSFITSTSCLSYVQTMVKNVAGNAPLRKNFWQLPGDGIDFLESLLAFSPNTRLSAKDALNHPFLKGTFGGEKNYKYPKPLDEVDWGFDVTCEVSEAKLRRLFWDEIEHWQTEGL